MWLRTWNFLNIAVFTTVFVTTVSSTVVQLSQNNLKEIVGATDVVFVDFYADWCQYSNQLEPVFADAAARIDKLYPVSGWVLFAKVDCDASSELCAEYNVMKYPTLKLFLFGEMVYREYRGQRSSDAIVEFIKAQFKDPIIEKHSLSEVQSVVADIRLMLVYVESLDSDSYRTAKKVASHFHRDCTWYAVAGEASKGARINGDVVYFRPEMAASKDEEFTDTTNKAAFMEFAMNRCVPLVQELTFDNAEELSEDGVPFLVLFRNPGDIESKRLFKEAVQREIPNEKGSIVCLIADGSKFLHPLLHLGKSLIDLPVLAIDTFKHMFLFKEDVMTSLRTRGVLRAFINDLYSEKLHREFHGVTESVPHVHAPIENQELQPKQEEQVSEESTLLPKDSTDARHSGVGTAETTVLDSKFKKLRPSHNRYTLLRDEL